MSIRVLTYTTPEQLKAKDSIFLEYKDALHITATGTLRDGLFEYLSKDRWIETPIVTFGHFLNKIGTENWLWYSSKTQLNQYSLISKQLRLIAEDNNVLDEKVFNAMSKNKDVLLRTIRMFTEANESSKSIQQKLNDHSLPEENLALRIWSELEKDVSFLAFEEWISSFRNKQHTRKVFSEMLEMILLDSYAPKNDNERQYMNLVPNNSNGEELKAYIKREVDRLIDKNRLILHGFYFITPIQQQIIESLSNAGFEIIHVINYQEGYGNVFEAVDIFLEKDKNQFTSVSTFPPYINKISQKFIEVCNGNFDLNLADMDNKYFEFNHMYQFKDYIEKSEREENDSKECLISPRAREIRQQVEDIESMKPLTLKDYPIGKFLLDLHQLNNTIFEEESKKFRDNEEVNLDRLIRIFASGYIHVQGQSTKLLVKYIKKLEVRLKLKTTLDDWITEINTILSDKTQIEEVLVPEDIELTDNNRFYGYYNRFLSYFDVPPEQLKLMKEAIENIQKVYNLIFVNEESNVHVKQYIENLEQYLSTDIVPNLNNSEVTVAEELIRSLTEMKNSDFDSFDRQDIIQGLRFFLSGELEETDNSLFGASLHNSRIVSLQDGDFIPFSDNQSVHLSFLDNKSLPLSQNLVTWPFNDESMELFYHDSLLQLVQNRKKYDAAITKYLLYLIMINAADLKFSIVKNVGEEKDLKPSFYLELLELQRARVDERSQTNDCEESSEYVTKTISMKRKKKSILLEETKNVCQKRFTLSYLLEESPSFEDDFHHEFLFRNFITQLHKHSKKFKVNLTSDEIYQMVSEWFPHWDETKKSMLRMKAEEWNKYYLIPTKEIDGVEFEDSLIPISLFGSKPKETTDNFANSGKHCMYCSFRNICRDGAKQYED